MTAEKPHDTVMPDTAPVTFTEPASKKRTREDNDDGAGEQGSAKKVDIKDGDSWDGVTESPNDARMGNRMLLGIQKWTSTQRHHLSTSDFVQTSPKKHGQQRFRDSNYSHVLTLGLQAPKIPVHIWLSSSSSCLEDDKSADRRHRCQWFDADTILLQNASSLHCSQITRS